MATIAIFNGIQRQIDSFNALLNCVNSLLNSVNHVHGMSIRELIAPGTVEVELPSVLNLTMRQLEAYAAIWGVLRRWDLILRNPGAYTLKSAMKIVPPNQAKLIVEAIKWGGLL